MSRLTHFRGLSAQLFYGVLLSLLAALIVFASCFSVGSHLLNQTVYGKPFTTRMADHQFSRLQNYVSQTQISKKNLHQLNVWCSRSDKVYLTIYLEGHIAYEFPMISEEKLDLVGFDIILENPEREYSLTLSDGTTAQAFLYYYAGDAYYYWAIVLSGMAACVAFSMCFITFVHRKLRYIQQLKTELDILAGGDLNYQISVKGADELAELASGIDQMRRSILAHQRAEEKMRSANSQLVTAMSHDLRTPMTSLLAYLELLDRGKYESKEQLCYFISRSLEKTLQIKSMADKLFEYFLVYSSEWEQPDMELVDADETIGLFWGEYAFSLESQGFLVQPSFGRLEGSLQVNMSLLRRAFDNLYSNLLKYADSSQPVKILCRREGENVCLTLTNQISKKRNVCQSTNIGLNTCRRILQYHGGTFETAEENGVFQAEVMLPLTSPKEKQTKH